MKSTLIEKSLMPTRFDYKSDRFKPRPEPSETVMPDLTMRLRKGKDAASDPEKGTRQMR